MIPKPNECQPCPGFWWNKGYGFSHPEGSGSNGVAIIGEALGYHESLDGLPFRPVAQAGSLLQRALCGRQGAGIPREQFVIYNTIQCRPPEDSLEGQSYEREVIQKCKVHRDRFFGQFKPRCVLALGGTALRTLTGFSGVLLNRGYPIWSQEYSCWVLGSLHPAFIQRGQKNLLGVLVHDIKRAVEIAGNKNWKTRSTRYSPVPCLQEACRFYKRCIESPKLWISVDIENPKIQDEEEETDHAPITQIQFSIEEGSGICFPWIERFRKIVKKILVLPNPKIGHNSSHYDFPILAKEGFEIRGPLYDTMEMFRHYDSNLAGIYHLQGVGSFFGADFLWKHLAGSDPGYYGCVDVDIPLRIVSQLVPEMKRLGIWGSYENHVRNLDRLVLKPMSSHGLYRDTNRIRILKTRLGGELRGYLEEMNKIVPDELKNVSPKNGYVKPPKEVLEKC